MSRYQFPAQATTDASLLVSGTLADARLSSNVALENTANTFTAKQSFSGTDHVGLCLLSLTTAQYNALTPANGDLFRDSTTDRIDARLARGTVELVDTAGGQVVAGNLAATTLMVGGASGPLLRNNAGTIEARNNANSAGAPFGCTNLTASGPVTTDNLRGSGATRLNIRSLSAGGSVGIQTTNGIDIAVFGGHNAPSLAISAALTQVQVGDNISSNANDRARWNSSFVRMNCSIASDLTGISSPVDGAWLYLFNVGVAVLTLKHESTNSAAVNRFLMAGSTDITLATNEWAFFFYDGISSRWRVRKV